MRIIQEQEIAGPRVIALGTFDGVHRGHQELIRQGKLLAKKTGAKLRVYTFDRHPLEILRPELAPGRLQTQEEQAEKMAACSVDELRIIPFTREMAETEPEDFLRMLCEESAVQAVVAGWNYTFGRKGRGNAEMLQAEGKAQGFQVVIVPPVRTQEGEVISSSAIRERLCCGDPEGAEEMLGYPYEISGTVVNGKHEGTRIGFPTANIEAESIKLLPAYGVYACFLESEGKRWKAVVNIGTQPTIPSGKVTVEAHALGAQTDLYNCQAKVLLKKYLRAEKKFTSSEALAEQITRDRLQAEEILSSFQSVDSACRTQKSGEKT